MRSFTDLLINLMINIPLVLVALTGHEFAHGWVSSRMGDPTPERQGRLTLNPFAHLDIVGTVLMALTGFGWAKPVQVDPRYYKNQKRGMALTAAAGPLANLVMAIAALVLYTIIIIITGKINIKLDISIAGMFLTRFASINICFMIFNLIPVPPLDGSRVLGMFLPNRAYYTMLKYERYFMLGLIVIALLTDVFEIVIGTGANLIMGLITKPLDLLIGAVLL